jgi:hypothetical protein
MNVKKLLRPFAVALGLLFAASPASAGFTSNSPVYIVTGNPGSSYGNVNSARFSSDSTQYIGCQLYPTTNLGLTQTSCFAKNSTGTYMSCNSTSPVIAQIAASINSTSYITFTATNGSCSYLTVENWSAPVR